jgi:hypothetical protein
MTEAELKKTLFKLSVEAIYYLSRGSYSALTIQEYVEKNSNSRPVLSCAQIMKVNNISDSEKEIHFVLSPDYLSFNRSLVLQADLDELKWSFKLPSYINEITEDLLPYLREGAKVQAEEGVIEWLISSEVDLIEIGHRTYDLDFEIFHNSIVETDKNKNAN